MRTIFEDVDERSDLEDDGQEKRTRTAFWLVALLMIAVASGTYYWITHRKPPAPPVVAVSLNDDNQLNAAANQFNGFVKGGNWEEAQKMLSAEALIRLRTEGKTLRESLLAEHLKDTLAEAALTPGRSKTPSTARLDSAYLFLSNATMIVPLTLVEENGRLVINSW
ncbi:MAG: hypothetical protein ABI882_04770 [Acidobacteriota bacterium]